MADTVNVSCSYHAPLRIETQDGSPPGCGCGAISLEAAAAEITRLRYQLSRFGTLPLESEFLVYGAPLQLIFRGPHGQVVLRQVVQP